MFTNLNEIKILTLFTNGFTNSYYIREIAKLAALSPRTALITLNRLEQEGILTAKTKGKIKLYAIRPSEKTKHHLILAENYKRITFLETHPQFHELNTNGTTIIFGSYAKGTQNKKSDLDLLVLDKDPSLPSYDPTELHIIRYPRKTFESKIETDILLRQVLNNHIVMEGTDHFITTVIRWLQSRGADST